MNDPRVVHLRGGGEEEGGEGSSGGGRKWVGGAVVRGNDRRRFLGRGTTLLISIVPFHFWVVYMVQDRRGKSLFYPF